LQSVQNTAAQLVSAAQCCDHEMLIPHSLH